MIPSPVPTLATPAQSAGTLRATTGAHQSNQKPKEWYCWWLGSRVSMGEYRLSYHDNYEHENQPLIVRVKGLLTLGALEG